MCLDTSHTSIAQRKNLATFSRIIYALDTILLVILLLVGCVYGAICYTVSEVITLDKTQFGAIIAENRKRQELTQQMLAQKLHVTDKAVSKWERGLSYPDVTLLQPLAAALGLQVDDLLSCRAAEMENDMTTSPIPHPSPVETVLTITAENRRRQRKRLLFAAAAVVLACGLLVTALIAERRKEAATLQQDILHLMSTYDYLREEYLPDEINREAKYILLWQLYGTGTYFENENFRALNDFIHYVIDLSPTDPKLNELYLDVENLDLWVDFRSGIYTLCGDIDALKEFAAK